MIDIVERLKFDAVRCEIQFSKGVAGNISEAAAEIERLREALQQIAEAKPFGSTPKPTFEGNELLLAHQTRTVARKALAATHEQNT